MRKKRMLIALAILASPITLIFLFLCAERVRGKISLARARHALVAQGYQLDPRKFATHSRDEDNGTPELIAAIGELRHSHVSVDFYSPRMKLTPAGRAIVCFAEPELVDAGKTNTWDDLASDLKDNSQALERIRATFKKPMFDNRLNYAQGSAAKFENLAPPKGLCNWFGSSVQLALHDGDTHKALPDLVSEVQLPKCLAEDHLIISEMVRDVLAASARNDTWEALQADAWTDDDLAKLEQSWMDEQFAPVLERALEGDTIFSDSCIELCRRSNQQAWDLLFGLEYAFPPDDSDRPLWEKVARGLPYGDQITPFLKREIFCRIWRFAWLDLSDRDNLVDARKYLEIARSAAAEKSFVKVQPGLQALGQKNGSANSYHRLRHPEMSPPITFLSFFRKSLCAETERSVILCAIALKRYQLRHGSPPPSLEALTPEYFASVPIDYMDGQPVKYHLKPGGGFVLYSVGEDGVDDHGDKSMSPGKESIRALWNRKDFVWPDEATREEVEAYRRSAGKQ
jgi:hypothetical protein